MSLLTQVISTGARRLGRVVEPQDAPPRIPYLILTSSYYILGFLPCTTHAHGPWPLVVTRVWPQIVGRRGAPRPFFLLEAPLRRRNRKARSISEGWRCGVNSSSSRVQRSGSVASDKCNKRANMAWQATEAASDGGRLAASLAQLREGCVRGWPRAGRPLG